MLASCPHPIQNTRHSVSIPASFSRETPLPPLSLAPPPPSAALLRRPPPPLMFPHRLAFLLLLSFAAFHTLLHLPRNEPAADIDIIRPPWPASSVSSDRSSALIESDADVISVQKRDAHVLEASLECDRSHFRTDVCVARGDVRVFGGGGGRRHPTTVLIAATPPPSSATAPPLLRRQIIRPYTRKWEESVMQSIDAVSIDWQNAAANQTSPPPPQCEVRHSVPAVLFSTGGYTGNVYHEFNDGIIPLYLSAGHLKGEVVLLILEYHQWWMTKYREVIEMLSKYEVVDLSSDKRVHCFSEVKVGLNIDGELAIKDREAKPSGGGGSGGGGGGGGEIRRTEANQRLNLLPHASLSMRDFQENVLRAAYLPKRNASLAKLRLAAAPPPERAKKRRRSSGGGGGGGGMAPRLAIVSRKSPRAMKNEREVAEMAAELGFEVAVVAPRARMEMAEIYWEMKESEVVVGVHGAALTHLLFMKRAAELIQVVPLGLEWAAQNYYGTPAADAGLLYTAYRISPSESSLSQIYASHHPVLSDPDSVNSRGWSETKRIYLQSQDLTLNLTAFRPFLSAALRRSIHRMRRINVV